MSFLHLLLIKQVLFPFYKHLLLLSQRQALVKKTGLSFANEVVFLAELKKIVENYKDKVQRRYRMAELYVGVDLGTTNSTVYCF